MARSRGRPKGSPANHHLFLEGGTWVFRWARHGRDVRRTTGCPKSEIAQARRIRDKWIGELEAKRRGVQTEEIPQAVTVGELIRLYREAESNPYDRERGGEQIGTKRDAKSDEVIVNRLKGAGLDFDLAADAVNTGHLVGTARKLAGLAPLTRRNTFRFLRCVYGWGRSKANRSKTGIVANPFDDLESGERGKLFSNEIQGEAPPFQREELRALYDLLPAHVFRPVRFAAHTGMRWRSEVLRMVWGRVDLKRKVYVVDPRWSKRGKKREVPLGAVARSILEGIRPEKPAHEDAVWLNTEGRPVRDVRNIYERAVRKVCPVPQPGSRYPDFHSLRRTCATALDQVASHGVVRDVLGHSKRKDVTSGYVSPSLDAQLAAVDRAALLIDGDPAENVVALPAWKMAEKMGVA